MEKGKRVEFACHTKMSELEGIDSVKEYIAEAVKRGYDSIAITDTNSVQAFMAAEEYIAYNNINALSQSDYLWNRNEVCRYKK